MAQADAVQKLVGEYGAAAKAKLANPATTGQPEDQLRNPLEILFAGLAAEASVRDVTLVGETSLADLKTRPDFSVTAGKALIGFIEAKAPGKGANPNAFTDPHDKAQWDKLKSLPNLIYTDGSAISLWRNGEREGDILRFEGGIDSAGAKLGAPAGLLALISNFLTWDPVAPRNAKQLAQVSARLCRFLRDEVLEQLGIRNSALAGLKEDWRALLFPDADDATFADGYAQAVTFGLLMAKSKDIALDDGLDAVARELSQTNTLIGTALRLLTEQDLHLGPALDTLTRVLDVVVWSEVSKGDAEAWLNFYEDFLEVYDNDLRKKTGSYYTPPEVVQAMVRLCDEALRSSRYGLPRGLAASNLHIADPAVGSGTFPLAILRRIAETIGHDEGEGSVGGAITEAAKRLYGFELQFGPFAVAQLRLTAEMMEFGASGTPQLFVTDTLADPNADVESGTGIYREISKSQRAANEVKRSAPITVVIGNPPYKEGARGKGAWVENGSGNHPGLLVDWHPPSEWGVGTHARHLRNLYVYFWRWAAWKVFEHGTGVEDQPRNGIVCYITVAGFLNGPGFQKMRADLRRECDEIWVIDCSPERHRPDTRNRIFQGVQQEICIVLASRSLTSGPENPAKVRFRSLAPGLRDAKFAELAAITLEDQGWSECPDAWRAPFLPARGGSWADYAPLEKVLTDCGTGAMIGRIWNVAPDASSLQTRWNRLLSEPKARKRAELFQPHEGGDRTIDKHDSRGLPGVHPPLSSVEFGIQNQASKDPDFRQQGRNAIQLKGAQRFGFRSFDRQHIIADNRLINRPNPGLWRSYGANQVHLTAPMDRSPTNGPAVTLTSEIPDAHHYNGRGGRVFALWKDAAATETNVSPAAVKALAKAFGAPVDPVDVFAYVAGVLAHPAFTATHREDLIRPGLRVPLTADIALFRRAADLGREVIWLHTFGERFNEGKPAGEPRLPEGEQPRHSAAHPIPTTPEGFPDTLDYDPTTRQLKVGRGVIENVPQAVWDYEVSGKNVLTQWFSYRKKDRSRPIIGDRRPPSPLGLIQPDHWLPEYTSELINVLNVLGLLVKLEPEQAELLQEIEDGPLIAGASPAG